MLPGISPYAYGGGGVYGTNLTGGVYDGISLNPYGTYPAESTSLDAVFRTYTDTAIPEPSTVAFLTAAASLGIVGFLRRRHGD